MSQADHREAHPEPKQGLLNCLADVYEAGWESDLVAHMLQPAVRVAIRFAELGIDLDDSDPKLARVIKPEPNDPARRGLLIRPFNTTGDLTYRHPWRVTITQETDNRQAYSQQDWLVDTKRGHALVEGSTTLKAERMQNNSPARLVVGLLVKLSEGSSYGQMFRNFTIADVEQRDRLDEFIQATDSFVGKSIATVDMNDGRRYQHEVIDRTPEVS
jgi:hypothetical protein